MKNYFIYQYEDKVSSTSKEIITVIFVHQKKIDSQNTLSQEINEFFQQHSLSDKLIVIIPEYLDENSYKYFTESKDITFQRLPGRSEKYFEECLSILKFQKNGELKLVAGKLPHQIRIFKDHLFRSGTTWIFKNNGGLVESSPDHHFVFPSDKHCSKFIRTGNVLIKSSEIFFIAIQLLKHFEDKKLIYCDTSSINVLPYTVFELLRRFNFPFDCPDVHSFESYEIFESHKERFHPQSLVLISSSTSGNIIDRLLKKELAERNQIKVIYFLGAKEKYISHQENIICNLTKDVQEFEFGEEEFKTYPGEDSCDLCNNHSRSIYIRGDVFLTIQPKIEKVLLFANDEYAPKYLSLFVENYRGKIKEDVILKSYFKEKDANLNYEIFIDTNKLFTKLEEGKFPTFNLKLSRLTDKHIPANLKYFIYLPDEGSETLAKLLKSKIPSNIPVNLLKLEKGFEERIEEDIKGSAVIVASCITTGKNLLNVSRLMRKHKDLSLVYFIGILRTPNEEYCKTLISNLTKGRKNSDENHSLL